MQVKTTARVKKCSRIPRSPRGDLAAARTLNGDHSPIRKQSERLLIHKIWIETIWHLHIGRMDHNDSACDNDSDAEDREDFDEGD